MNRNEAGPDDAHASEKKTVDRRGLGMRCKCSETNIWNQFSKLCAENFAAFHIYVEW